MARPNKIWFRKDVGWWIVTLGGQKVRLTQGRSNRKPAEQKFHEINATQARPPEASDDRVADRGLGFASPAHSACRGLSVAAQNSRTR